MRATKAMKSMRRMKKAKRVSVIAKGKRARSTVFNGTKEKTRTGLTKAMLIKNKNGSFPRGSQSAEHQRLRRMWREDCSGQGPVRENEGTPAVNVWVERETSCLLFPPWLGHEVDKLVAKAGAGTEVFRDLS